MYSLSKNHRYKFIDRKSRDFVGESVVYEQETIHRYNNIDFAYAQIIEMIEWH